jgi:hypothetical protein
VDGVEIAGNIIWNTQAYTIIFGHSNTNNANVHNNTIGGAGYGPYNITGTGYQMNENITWGGQFAIPNLTTTNYTGDRNLYYQQYGSAPLRVASPSKSYTSIATWYADTGQDQNSQIGDPQFVNAATYATVMEGVEKSTASTLVLRSVTGFVVGDHVQINGDGVVRTVTAVDTVKKSITFDVPLPAKPLTQYMIVENWKASTNFVLDLRLKPTSPANTMGATGGVIGGTISTLAYSNGDFNNDGKRDIPTLPADVKAGLIDPNNWPPSSF